jgi:secondary thiamine-phosphate synthase enzyme
MGSANRVATLRCAEGPLTQSLGQIDVETAPASFSELTRALGGWLREIAAADGLLTVFVKHTSASLTIQENADPDVRRDLSAALARLAPEEAGYAHDTEGPDDMPAHIKAMLTGVSLAIPVRDGGLDLGTWQGVYLIEHRARAHRRVVSLVYHGTKRA